MLRVGLTGGIGAGKSTVARRLAALGAAVVDADLLAREVVEPGSDGLAAVVSAFGPGVLAGDGTLDRPALGRLVFADGEARARLNGILHPRIADLTRRRIAALPADAIVVHDVPLLVENRLGANYHLVLVVAAPEPERIRRLVTERGMGEADAVARVGAQAGDAARRAAADVWLDNSGTPAGVATAVDALWSDRLVPFERNVRTRTAAARPTPGRPVAPDPSWPVQAARLAARVARAVGDAALRVDHHGSTAVPGLAARDVLDLQLVVADLAAADAVRPALEDAGFVRASRRRDRSPDGSRSAERVHTAADPGRPANLHVRPVEGQSWRDALRFRDWLRTHDDERDGYAAVRWAALRVGVGDPLVGDSPREDDAIGDGADVEGPWITAALERSRRWAERTGWAPAAPE